MESRSGELIQIADAHKAYCLEIPLPAKINVVPFAAARTGAAAKETKIKVAEMKNFPLMQSASNNKSVKSACLSLVS